MRKIDINDIRNFERHLINDEKAETSIKKYVYELERFKIWLAGQQIQEISKEAVYQWKEHLCYQGYSPVSVNASLAALHSFFAFKEWNDCRVKYLKIQRKVFRDASKDLSKSEYTELISAAMAKGNERLALIMESICATGIRVSEIKYLTVESVKKGRSDIFLKGKIRTILIPGKLRNKLLKYAKKQKISTGEIFITAGGKGISRRQIWKEMKNLCYDTNIDERKVFPHNLRHLFAVTFYKCSRDIVRLADVLGHSSIETTRIYLITTSTEYDRQLQQLGLIT